MRIDVGPGYRLYFMRRAENVYLLLAGGDKSTQVRDIRRAKAMVRELKETSDRDVTVGGPELAGQAIAAGLLWLAALVGAVAALLHS